jgi:hypothetical protein
MKALKFKTQTMEERVVHAMLSTIFVLALVYCAVLLSIVFSVIERKQDLITIKDLTSQISYLENDYVGEIAKVDNAFLKENKFERISNTTFAVRKDSVASFAILYERN